MKDFTQKDYDEACVDLKNGLDKMLKDSGCDSYAMAIAMNKSKDITNCLYDFQELVNPTASDMGIKTITLSELLGVEIILTVS